jgi:antitoxin MazE
MITRIRRWGTSLAIRLPQSVVNQLNLSADSEVNIIVEGHKIIVSPVNTPDHTLQELLDNCPPESLGGEIADKENWS